MNETLINATNQTLNFTSFSQEFVTEIYTNYNPLESIFFIIMYLGLILLSYKIYKTIDKINNDIKYESVNYFAKAFKYYFTFYLLLNLIEIITIINYFRKSSSLIILTLILISIIFMLILPWIARTYLFESIIYKYFEKDLPTKFSKNMFFFFIAFLIAIDFIIYIITYLISPYAFIIYTFLLLAVLVIFIYKKEGSYKKILKQIPQLTIILLIFLRLTNVFEMFYEEDIILTYLEYFNLILTFILYSFILIKLKKWRLVLTK